LQTYLKGLRASLESPELKVHRASKVNQGNRELKVLLALVVLLELMGIGLQYTQQKTGCTLAGFQA
jgi:hypothetical protein